MSQGNEERDRVGGSGDAPLDEEFALAPEVKLDLSAQPDARTLPGVADLLTPAHEAAPPPSAGARREAWERLWVAGMRVPWTSLALVPAVPGVPVQGVAEALVNVGGEYCGRPVELIDARGVTMSQVRELSERVGAARERHALVIMLDSPLVSQSTQVVAHAASAALLVVPVGPTLLGEARRTIEAVGRSRFIGAVTLQPPPS